MIALWCHVGFYCACLCVKLLQSCPTLCDLWTVACKAPLSMGFSRQEYWSGLPCPPPGDLPNPGIESVFLVFWIGRQVLYHFVIWEAQGQGFLKYDSWTSSISITWEFVRNISSWDFPRHNEWQTLREGPTICIFISLPLDSIHTSLKTVAVSIFQTEEMGRSIAGHGKLAPQNQNKAHSQCTMKFLWLEHNVLTVLGILFCSTFCFT